jgi:hypothetical protein
MSFIETHSGLQFTLENPQFNITDIAHSLSLLCRYNGHCKQFYSVAQHSLMVSYLMEELNLGDPLQGLLHDATEAYLSDVPKPFKAYLPDWQNVDTRLEAYLAEWAGIDFPYDPGCKEADMLALFIEARELLESKGRGMAGEEAYLERAWELMDHDPAKWSIKIQNPFYVAGDFVARYSSLVTDKVYA